MKVIIDRQMTEQFKNYKVKDDLANYLNIESKNFALEGAIAFIKENINELNQEINTSNLEYNEETNEPNRNSEIEYYIESIKGKYKNVLDCLNILKYLVERKYWVCKTNT